MAAPSVGVTAIESHRAAEAGVRNAGANRRLSAALLWGPHLVGIATERLPRQRNMGT
jgi:hypothetical protein